MTDMADEITACKCSGQDTQEKPEAPGRVHIAALVCAAGVGARMGLGHPKQYMRIAGEPMLLLTLCALARVPRIESIHVVVSPDDPYIDGIADRFPRNVVLHRAGGAERAESVRNGLLAANFDRENWVLVHDAARPCVKASEIDRLLDEVLADESVAGGILALPMADTVKRVDARHRIVETVPRKELWRAATPQLFRAGTLIEALDGSLEGITDEASAVERLGLPVKVVAGRATNIKVTNPGDERVAELILGEEHMVPFRVGQGYDSHRLVEGRPLILGGVEIPFEKGLDGHSDADVLLHAVTDAVLGAAALGDIGQHFPPSDPKWKGADSGKLLAAIVELVHSRGWTVVNLDATIVAERPKIGPHMPAIRRSVAALLGVGEDVVNVKAKTNEKMDDVGREAGMMAHAVVLLARSNG